MREILTNISLRQFNTFGIDAKTAFYAEAHSADDLQYIRKTGMLDPDNMLVIGGGSNILLTGDFKGIVVRNMITGIKKVREDENHIYLSVGAGENWHEFVLYCIEKGYAGIENLSLIPGTVGAAPMQNIGAYGVEIKDVFESLKAFHIESGEIHTFDTEKCDFGYRYSVFKGPLKGKYIITNVNFRLNKTPEYNVDYGTIQDTLKEMNVTELSIRAISDAVIAIRSSKLPDPAEIGNAGSFFKNPEIPDEQFKKIHQNHPEIPSYPASKPGHTKVPAGWLIDHAGWKGKTFDKVGVHKNQALVIVNYGGGTGRDIKDLSEKIRASVKKQYGIELEPEVNFI